MSATLCENAVNAVPRVGDAVNAVPCSPARSQGDGISNLRDHVYGPARALGSATSAASAVVIVELIALSRPEFDHGGLRADREARVALKAVAAR